MTKLSYQLYSSRNFPPLESTFSMLADIGYSQVEGYGSLYDSPAELASLLNNAGLTMPSGHFGLDELETNPEKTLETARLLSMTAIYCPFLDASERPDDKPGWQSFGKRLTEAGKPYRDAGFKFGWHNHDFEFQSLNDGSLPIEAIFEGGPELSWEADIAWIVRGGADPLYWIERLGNHISAVHLKDIAKADENLDEDGWSDVGYGTMDWPGLLDSLKSTPCDLYVIEHDNPGDHERFAHRSYQKVQEIIESPSN
ncbi:MAG: sugar phosphate isomerase/epimerase family protein [Rhizobiaceae bacterium]